MSQPQVILLTWMSNRQSRRAPTGTGSTTRTSATPSTTRMWIEDLDDGLFMVIGPDATAGLLEIGIVEGPDGPVVIHAVHARANYLR